MRARKIAVLAAAVAVAVPALAVPADAGSRKLTVKIGDNFFSPSKKTVKKKTKVTWVWPTDVGDTHDVKLYKAPKGVKKWQTDPYATDYRKSYTLRKAGTYKFLCTFHSTEMRMTIRVKSR